MKKINYCSQKCWRGGRTDSQRLKSFQLQDGESVSTTIYLKKETLARLERLERDYNTTNRSYVIEKLINQNSVDVLITPVRMEIVEEAKWKAA
jgi:hypothetical protein